ncbi:hypothetical protein MFMK1_003363 [Metallumcola ferriviriculae]|uniref:DUF58 domain-containing protein n=1 Tax=Metallumcola ferriviriculae TaxID=3039180 RepID=A0AAU0URA1_9FIRM|nr:hypothetical protein MFMK1_003363 [Desulfitibacteraceae bacterium MK1]
MRLKLPVTLLWLAIVSLLLSRLGMGQQALPFVGAVALVITMDILVAYLAGIMVQVCPLGMLEAVRMASTAVKVKQLRLLRFVPHNFSMEGEAKTGKMVIKQIGSNELQLIVNRRGFYDAPRIKLHWQDPLGFFKWRRKLILADSMWVYPRIQQVNIRQFYSGGDEILIEGTGVADRRRIHWRATAATGKLMIRQPRHQAEIKMLVIFSGDEEKDSQIADEAASWWQAFRKGGLRYSAIVAAADVHLVNMAPNSPNRMLKILARAKGPYQYTGLAKVMGTIQTDDQVIVAGEIPKKFSGRFSQLKVGSKYAHK